MKRRSSASALAQTAKVLARCGVILWLAAPRLLAEPTTAAASAFNVYSKAVEARLAQQRRSSRSVADKDGFLASPTVDWKSADGRLRQGELIVEQLTPSNDREFPGALLHHWRGTAFAPGAKAADFDRLMRDVNAYPQHFSPQVIRARGFALGGDRMEASMRVRQKHVITVVMDTVYVIDFGRLDARYGYSVSHSIRIEEIDRAGTGSERALSADEEHGFLWRQNTYWSYEEREGGLYLQIESVSLTRAVPHGLGWVVKPYIESIPRESLEFTLRSVCSALRK
ncbi:MAG TPA: hypothetical protein VNU92_13515 [Edaphobacter sp.]|nr:hypothetical protein [Edaphobacter sp.]